MKRKQIVLLVPISFIVMAVSIHIVCQWIEQNRLLKISFGAYPLRTSFGKDIIVSSRQNFENLSASKEKNVITYLDCQSLKQLSDETGLVFTGNIVYIKLNSKAIREFRKGKRPHYLSETDISNLQKRHKCGIIPRLSLEPTIQKDKQGVGALACNQDILIDIAKTLHNIGPATMRVASELNLYDSPYHVRPHYPRADPQAIGPIDDKEMAKLKIAFQTVHRIFKSQAPNIKISFSAFIPNGPDCATRQRSLKLIQRYLPYVAPYVDMYTGTFYPHNLKEVDGLVQYVELIKKYDKPFGIDELGCKDEEAFSRVMTLIRKGQLGDLRFVNFFDCHVVKSDGRNNTWHLKSADIALLHKLSRRWL